MKLSQLSAQPSVSIFVHGILGSGDCVIFMKQLTIDACDACDACDYPLSIGKPTRGLECWASSVADAKERALELTSTRDANDQKLIEDQLARERAQQHVQRNELFRQKKLDLLEQDGEVEDVTVSTGGRHDQVEFAREACRNLLDQLFSLRGRIVKTMQMELLRREQLNTFQSQYDKLEAELRASQRLQRTYARGGTTAGIMGDVPVQQLQDIGMSVARQHALLGTYQSVLKERREIWELAVSHIQKLKIVISTKGSELQTTLQEVRLNMAALKKKSGGIHAKNESLAILRASVESETKTMQNRVKLLTREQSLLNSHDGNFFDSDIWQQGVTQRMSKETFAQDLQVLLKPPMLRVGFDFTIAIEIEVCSPSHVYILGNRRSDIPDERFLPSPNRAFRYPRA